MRILLIVFFVGILVSCSSKKELNFVSEEAKEKYEELWAEYCEREEYESLTPDQREKARAFLFRHANGALFTEGEMPSVDQAKSIRKDALAYGKHYLDLSELEREEEAERPNYPKSIEQLKPLDFEVTKDGVFLYFKKDFVELYGYYYAFDSQCSSMDNVDFLDEKLATGVYRYYNPG